MKDFFTTRFQTITDFFSGQKIPTTDLKNIFSWGYWSENYLPSSSIYTAFTVGLVLLLVVFLLFWRRQLKKLHAVTPVYQFQLDQLLSMVFFIVIMTFSYAFFRAQQIAYASSRLVLLVSLLVIIVWLVVTIVHLRRVVTAKRTSYLEKERFFRYLPKKRK